MIKDENLCVLFVTETWLKSENDDDNLWKKATCIQIDNNYHLHCVDTLSEHKGGGLAWITKKEWKAKSVQGGITRTSEYGSMGTNTW